jgi:hypothetical protein
MNHSNHGPAPIGKVAEVDGRRRISLGALAQHDRYFVTVDDQQRIILTPAIVVPAAVDEFLDNPASGVRRDRPEGDHA